MLFLSTFSESPSRRSSNLAAIAKLKVGSTTNGALAPAWSISTRDSPFDVTRDRCSLTGLPVANCVFVPHPKDLDCLDSMLPPASPLQEARTLTMKYTAYAGVLGGATTRGVVSSATAQAASSPIPSRVMGPLRRCISMTPRPPGPPGRR